MPFVDNQWLCVASLLFFGVMLAVQEYYNRPLKTAEVRNGIVSLELAGDAKTTQDIFDAWGNTLRKTAIKSVLWDYGFVVSYAIVVVLACRWAGRAMSQIWGWPAAPGWGTLFAVFGILAAILDSIEDASLLWQLYHVPAALLARTARHCAIVKFTLLGVCLGFVAGGALAWSLSLISARLAS